MGATPTIHQVRDCFSVWDVWIETPYNADYIEMLKVAVPHRQRRWDPEEKVWYFRGTDVIDTVTKMLVAYFGSYAWAETWEQAEAEPVHRNDLATAYSTLHLLPSAPSPLVRAAHRTLAKLNHPDVGGSTETMQRINAAVQQIESAQVKEFA